MAQNRTIRNTIHHSLFDLLHQRSPVVNPPAVVSYTPSTPSASQIVDSFFDLNGPTESAPVYLARALARADASRHNNNVNEHQKAAGQEVDCPIADLKIDFPHEITDKETETNEVGTKSGPYFELLHQPNEKQRKSYKKENRYILPNPMTVCLTKAHQRDLVSVKRGSVTVKLLYETGDDLEESRKNILEGTKTRALDAERTAQFHLKIKETSERSKFRLHFTVRFEVNGEMRLEQIMSHSFRVTSNKKNSSVERPKPFAIQPSNGIVNAETEVWIRGSNFTDRAGTSVKFGGKEGRVIETEDNLLICYAPSREDISDNTTVDVEVSNFHPDFGPLKGTRTIKFCYVADRKRKKSKGSEEMEATVSKTQPPEPGCEDQTFAQDHLKDVNHDDMILSDPPNGFFQSPRLEDIIRSEYELARLFPHYASEAL